MASWLVVFVGALTIGTLFNCAVLAAPPVDINILVEAREQWRLCVWGYLLVLFPAVMTTLLYDVLSFGAIIAILGIVFGPALFLIWTLAGGPPNATPRKLLGDFPVLVFNCAVCVLISFLVYGAVVVLG